MTARWAGRFALLLAALAAAPALAHERSDRALGVVERVSAEEIAIRAADGHTVAFTITPETRFSRGDAPARREDVREGQRAVVEGKTADGRTRAVRVKLGVPESK